MTASTNNKVPEHVWRVPVRLEDVPEAGRHFELSTDLAMREAVAKFAGVDTVPALSATFDVVRRGKDGLRVSGEVRARVGQTCIVSLEPMESEIVEAVDVVFEPPRVDSAPVDRALDDDPDAMGAIAFGAEDDPPEPLLDGVADLGVLATEFLLLGINPYPRKPDTAFEPPATDLAESGPFAALAKLKRGEDGGK
ncbi:MAG: YceD family protein [Rhizomicrobium sp.]